MPGSDLLQTQLQKGTTGNKVEKEDVLLEAAVPAMAHERCRATAELDMQLQAAHAKQTSLQIRSLQAAQQPSGPEGSGTAPAGTRMEC